MRTPFVCKIAGLSHHTDESSNGKWPGTIELEPENKYDPTAVAIFNDNYEKIGYIPRDKTRFIRIWGDINNGASCECKVDINEYYHRWEGEITVFDPEYQDLPPKKHTDRKLVYVSDSSPYMSREQIESLVTTFGDVTARYMSQNVDYVVYGTEEPYEILCKKKGPKYHYEVVSVGQYVAKALNEDNRDDRFFGKEFAFGFKLNGDNIRAECMKLAAIKIIENGGTVVPIYRKKSTDCIIELLDKSPSKIARKAIEDGKSTILISDIIPIEVVEPEEPGPKFQAQRFFNSAPPVAASTPTTTTMDLSVPMEKEEPVRNEEEIDENIEDDIEEDDDLEFDQDDPEEAEDIAPAFPQTEEPIREKTISEKYGFPANASIKPTAPTFIDYFILVIISIFLNFAAFIMVIYGIYIYQKKTAKATWYERVTHYVRDRRTRSGLRAEGYRYKKRSTEFPATLELRAYYKRKGTAAIIIGLIVFMFSVSVIKTQVDESSRQRVYPTEQPVDSIAHQ